nr:unnamed protein product [Callosobruchus analis]
MQSSVSRANGILLSFHRAISTSTEIIRLLSEKNAGSKLHSIQTEVQTFRDRVRYII